MTKNSRKALSIAIAQLMPRIIQGVQLEFLVKQTMTQTQFLVLVAIHSRQTCPMSTLAQKMHVSMPTMTGIVDRLVKKGFLCREISVNDRRQVMVKLSEQGQNMIREFQASVSRRWSEVLEILDQTDIDTFASLIAKLEASLKEEV